MPKGYLVANIRVNAKKHLKIFLKQETHSYQKYGGKILARGSHTDRHEGNISDVITLLEFESKEAVK